ncbi:MAG: hypothetical protein R6V06_08720 [Kiritimatiellia bacterium]
MAMRSDLLLLGIGGGGCKLVCSIVRYSDINFKALAIDTDAASSREAGDAAIEFLLIGRDRLLGNGTGGDVASGRAAADDDMNKLEAHISEVRMVMVLTSLGSGTGGGATPRILAYLKERGLTTFCFATLPFSFEGASRFECADGVVSLVQDFSDTLVTVSFDDLAEENGSDNLQEAMDGCFRTLGAAVALVWRLVCSPGYIQLDAERMRSLVMQGRGGRLGFAGSSDSGGRASEIIDKLARCKLLTGGSGKIADARALMVGIIGGDDLLLSEISMIMAGIESMCTDNPRIEMGTVQDAAFNERVEVVIFAFENWNALKPVRQRVQSFSGEPPVADFSAVSKSSRRHNKSAPATKLSVGPSGRGRFQNSEPTFYQGDDLDIPAFLRHGLNIER